MFSHCSSATILLVSIVTPNRTTDHTAMQTKVAYLFKLPRESKVKATSFHLTLQYKALHFHTDIYLVSFSKEIMANQNHEAIWSFYQRIATANNIETTEDFWTFQREYKDSNNDHKRLMEQDERYQGYY